VTSGFCVDLVDFNGNLDFYHAPCYTTKCDTIEDGLTECAPEGNQGGGLRMLTDDIV
jgi:hypothetical protein